MQVLWGAHCSAPQSDSVADLNCLSLYGFVGLLPEGLFAIQKFRTFQTLQKKCLNSAEIWYDIFTERQRLKVHRCRRKGRLLCSIRPNRKWSKRKSSLTQNQGCFFVCPISDSNLTNFFNIILRYTKLFTDFTVIIPILTFQNHSFILHCL